MQSRHIPMKMFAFIALSASMWILALLSLSQSSEIRAQEDAACMLELGAWTSGAAAPKFHLEGAAAPVSDQIYLLGGFQIYTDNLKIGQDVDVYDPIANLWSTRKPMPLGVSHAQAAVDGRYIWMAGGFEGDNGGPTIDETWRYDTLTDEWWQGPDLPMTIASGALVRHERTLHYFAGVGADRRTDQAVHWTLDLDNPVEWVDGHPFPPTRKRNHFQGVEIDGLIYLVGGQQGHDGANTDIDFLDIYNPTTGAWSTGAPLPAPRSHFEAATIAYNGRIIILSGKSNPSGGDWGLTSVLTYNPQTDEWSALRPLPEPLYEAIAAVVDDKLVVTAGGNHWSKLQDSTYIAEFTETCSSNASPTAQNDIYAMSAGTTLTVNAASGVLANDTDPEGGALTATVASTPDHAQTFSFNQDGGFTYTPEESFIGEDFFTYTASNGEATSPPATVTLKVGLNDYPGAVTERPTLYGDLSAGTVRPQVVWLLNPDVTWYNVVIRQGETVIFDQWYPSDELCDDIACLFAPNEVDFPAGLLNGEYTLEISTYNDDDGVMVLGEPIVFTVDVPAPLAPSDPLVDVVSGLVKLTLPDDPGTTWLQVYVGNENYTHLQWYKLEQSAACDMTTCALLLDAYPPTGDYAIWFRQWGPGGFVNGDSTHWEGAYSLNLDLSVPQLIEGLSTTNDGNTFLWSADAHASWYNIWIGTSDWESTAYFDWHRADALGCAEALTCTLTPDISLQAGNTYLWYVRAWGAAGFTSGGTYNGWAESAPITK